MEITANTAQTIAVNQNVLFTDIAVPGSPSVIHRSGSGLVKLRGLTKGQPRARFKISFGGNMSIPSTGTAGAISAALSVDGEAIQTSQMIITPGAVSQYFNVGTEMYLDVPAGCCSTVGVTNNSTQSITIQNANLIVERVA